MSQAWYRRAGLGVLLMHAYHRPLNRVRSVLAEGGPLGIRETERQRAEMEEAASRLPALPVPAHDTPLKLQMLSGRRFWYQTAFCVHSFVKAAGEPVSVDVYDDGTLAGEPAQQLTRLGSAIRIHPVEDSVARLDRWLPENRFPALRSLWKSYIPIRKLTDVHAGAPNGWKLFVDSDLLFFRKPALILDWLRAPQAPLHAVDCIESYGYSLERLEGIAKRPIPRMLNTGLCGLRTEDIDWEALEHWCVELTVRERAHYFVEQALVAIHSSRYENRVFAPRDDYITMPDRAEVRTPQAVMHHYVAASKRWYFRQGWRHIVARP